MQKGHTKYLNSWNTKLQKEYKADGIGVEMDDLLKEEGESEGNIALNSGITEGGSEVGQEQIQDLLFSEKLSWQAIIYDLINTEQLNPWDIDLVLLTNKYLEKVRALEGANFFVSSKVLFAAALLLRIKSDILLNSDLQSLDDILFGKKEDKKYIQERIELDEEIPGLVARTPLPRFKKVTLAELIASLGKAIATENRRISKVVLAKRYEKEAEAVMPRHTINLKDKISEIYQKLLCLFEKREEKLAFSEISGETREERVLNFVSLLHLDNQQKVWLEQEGHFDEIWILLKHLYDKKYASELEQMRKDVEMEFERLALEEKEKVAEEKEKIESKIGKSRGRKKKENELVDVRDDDRAEVNEGAMDGKTNNADEVKDNSSDEFNSDKVENYEKLENAFDDSLNSVDSVTENEMDEEGA